jgi:creatinine amidohydrolase
MAEMREWRNLAWPDFEALDPERTLAILPCGAIEQHGPHLPVAVDAVIAEEIARRSAARMTAECAALILPTSQVGKSTEHVRYPGTLTLSAETLTRVWTEIGDSVARAGVRRLVFLNAHGGQPQVMEIVCRDLRVRHRMLAVATSWASAGFPEGLVEEAERRHGIHGGTVETAMMLHLRPELVDMSKAEAFEPVSVRIEAENRRLRLVGPTQIGWMAQDLHPMGVAGDASAATAELGSAIVEGVVARYAELLDEVAAYPLERLRER